MKCKTYLVLDEDKNVMNNILIRVKK